MELSMNVEYLKKQRGTSDQRDIMACAKIVKEAGFDYVDFAFYNHSYIASESWRTNIERILEGFNKIGVIVDQAHAPFVHAGLDEDVYKEYMRRGFEGAHILGANHIVIHGDKYKREEDTLDSVKALNDTYDFYAPYVEYAKKIGLGVAIENVPERSVRPHTWYTARVEEQIELIEKFNDPIVTACWDFGHGMLSYAEDHIDALKKIGPYLTCTHVHDNHRGVSGDLHMTPFFGKCEWEDVMAVLKEIKYKGKFTFEMVYGTFPDALVGDYMKFLHRIGEYLVSL